MKYVPKSVACSVIMILALESWYSLGDRLTAASRNLTTVGHLAVHDGKLSETVSRSPLSLANNAPSSRRPQLTLPFVGFSGRGGIQNEDKIDSRYQPCDTRSVLWGNLLGGIVV